MTQYHVLVDFQKRNGLVTEKEMERHQDYIRKFEEIEQIMAPNQNVVVESRTECLRFFMNLVQLREREIRLRAIPGLTVDALVDVLIKAMRNIQLNKEIRMKEVII